MPMPRTTQPSRRAFLHAAGMVGAAAWLAPRELLGHGGPAHRMRATRDGPVQQIRMAAATDPITVQRVRGGLSVLSGSGGNVVAQPGPDGVLLVDSGIVGSKVAAAVATATRTPIRHVINSHWHFDHTDANAWLASRGAHIVAHEHTRRHLSTDTRVEDWDFTFPRSPDAALPARTFATAQVLDVNGARIALTRYAPAHTDSDISIHFTDADVLHVADTWWNGLCPFIDYSTGGSIDGMIRATEENLATATASTVIVPGHGAVGGRAQLARYHHMLLSIRDRVARLKSEGRTVVQAVAARPTAAFDAEWGRNVIGPDFFTRLVYRGV